MLRLVYFRKPNAMLENGLRGFRAIALLIVFSKWHTTVLVDMYNDEKVPSGWKRFARGSRKRSKLVNACKPW